MSVKQLFKNLKKWKILIITTGVMACLLPLTVGKKTKNLELFKKEPLAFMIKKAQRFAIDSYLTNNKLTF